MYFAAALILLRTIGRAEEYRATLPLNGSWTIVETSSNAERPLADGGRSFSVPGLVDGTGEGGAKYAWFTRTIEIPPGWKGQRIFLVLGGARWDPRVYLDGRFVAGRLEGYTPFEIEITSRVRPGRSYDLAIRCRDWSATFADGFTLPAKVSGELRYAPDGKILAPIGGHFSLFGLWDDVRLEARPPVHLADLAVTTSWRDRLVSISGTVLGDTAGLWVDADVNDGANYVMRLEGGPVRPDGGWGMGEPLTSIVVPWSPEHPRLYDLHVALRRGRGGPVLDRWDQRIGFRELLTRGPDFTLNGVKRHLLATATWPTTQTQPREQVREVLEQVKASGAIAMRLHTQPWREVWLEEADRAGVMIIEEAALWCDGSGYAYADPRFWENYRTHVAGMIRRDRNHPSLVMWSLENELLHCGADKQGPSVEAHLAEIGRFAKALDPGHLITYEADLDPGGVADVIGLHYPHELPDYSDYPNTCDWLDHGVLTGTGGGLMGSRGAGFRWDRTKPLYIGEYLWVPTQTAAPGTVFFGDDAYRDVPAFGLKAKARAWVDQTLAYRRAGVSGVCPWTEFEGSVSRFPLDLNPDENPLLQAQREAYRTIAVYPRERDSRFFGGTAVDRTLEVYNDSPGARTLDLRWRVGVSGAWSHRALSLEPATRSTVVAKVELPRVGAKTSVAFEVALDEGESQLQTWTRTITIEPRRTLAAPRGPRWLLFDPAGRFAGPLAAAGIGPEQLRTLAGVRTADPARTILIVAPGAFVPPAASAGLPEVGREIPGTRELAAFLAAGGRAVVLEQDSYAGMPFGVALVEHASTMTFALDPRHPLFKALAQDDLSLWRGDHMVTRKEFRRPAGPGGARALAVSGGANELEQAPIVEVPYGLGSALLIQALVGEKFGTEPAARTLLANALAYVSASRVTRRPAALLSDDPAFASAIGRLGIPAVPLPADGVEAGLRNTSLLLMHGGGPALMAAGPQIAAWLKEDKPGRAVYWHMPESEAFAGLKGPLGLGDSTVLPCTGPVEPRDPADALLSGVARADVDFRGPTRGWGWEASSDPDPAVADRGFFPLLPGTPEGERLSGPEFGVRAEVFGADDHGVGVFTNGRIEMAVTVAEPGPRLLAIRASGTPLAGVYPLVVVRVDCAAVGRISASSTVLADYPVPVELSAGCHDLELAFVNDEAHDGEDRNLRVESVTVPRHPSPPPVLVPLMTPPVSAAARIGRSLVVVDGIRWDTNAHNVLRGERYAATLLGNLGAPFTPPGPEPSWVPAAGLVQDGTFDNFSRHAEQIDFGSNGAATGTFLCVAPGRYAVSVRGASSIAKGEWGEAEVKVDGAVIGAAHLASGTIGVFPLPAPVTLTAGEHTLTVRFTNDEYDPSEDRNLSVAAIGFQRE